MKHLLIIQGHPDREERHLCHALADAYEDGATAAGHDIRELDVARLDFPLLRSEREWKDGPLTAALQHAQAGIAWAHHIVFFFPLWLGDMPALLKGFLEQVARPGFAFKEDEGNPFARKGLAGRSARIVVTTQMPALAYRWYFRPDSHKTSERTILGFVGIAPVHQTLVGDVEHLGEAGRRRWLSKMKAFGRAAG
jgi:putative NADPH-quinone reductase